MTSHTQFIDRYSPKYAAESRHNCKPYRPCNREMICPYCWERKQNFILRQFVFFCSEWDWSSLITLSLLKFKDPQPMNGVLLLSAVRSFIHPRLFRRRRYFSVIAIEGKWHRKYKNRLLRWIPHFHIVTSAAVTKGKVGEVLSRSPDWLCEYGKFRFHAEPIKDSYEDHERLGIYLLDKNYRRTLEYVYPLSKSFRGIRRPRLLTVSKGFYCGKPKRLPFVDYWEAGGDSV